MDRIAVRPRPPPGAALVPGPRTRLGRLLCMRDDIDRQLVSVAAESLITAHQSLALVLEASSLTEAHAHAQRAVAYIDTLSRAPQP